ncbi:MAG: family 43 glycosylhydrolase [Bacteroides sp.]|nr:family 43 glycosylhydrolase [Bacteroides sp.]
MKKVFCALIAPLLSIAELSAANPVLPQFHADPEILYSENTGKYYIYSTTDGYPGWGGTYFTCYSSSDLNNWEYEGVTLDLSTQQVPWAEGDAWAPAIEEVKTKDGAYRYYFYFSGRPVGGGPKQIGVATSESPTGPFTAKDTPMTESSPIGRGQQIDVDVFVDPVSGKPYLYWGNGYMAGAELDGDMMSIKPETITVMTPEGGTLEDYRYREAPYVFFRNGTYYFLWSVDDTGSPNYHVSYGTSDNPLGPITVADNPVVLRQCPDKKIYGTAHNSILQIPGTDQWFVVYHRINHAYLNDKPGIHREVCIDKLEFNPDGTIRPVNPS